MISYSMVIIFQGRLWPRHVCTDGPVVTEYVCWIVDFDLKYTQLLAKGLYNLYCIIHCSELRPNVYASTELCLLLNKIIGNIL